MKPELGLESFPIWCERCGRQGYIFAREIFGDPLYIICETCGWSTAIVTCDKCGTGGSLVEDIEKHPTGWTCSACKITHPLPTKIYDHPTRIYFEDELPEEVRAEVVREESRPEWMNAFFHVFAVAANIGVGAALVYLLPRTSAASTYAKDTLIYLLVAGGWFAAFGRFWLKSPRRPLRLMPFAAMACAITPLVYRYAMPRQPSRVIDVVSIALYSLLMIVTLENWQSSPLRRATGRSPAGR